MSDKMIIDTIGCPGSVDQLIDLARYGAKAQIRALPRIDVSPADKGRKHPSFRLVAVFSVNIGGKLGEFENTYAKGHEVAPPKAAANGFVIANSRLTRDLKRLREVGVKCDATPFRLAELLPRTDLSEFEPHKPYDLDQFALLASIGLPVEAALETCAGPADDGEGAGEIELTALYSIRLRGKEYRIETRHGRYRQGADQSVANRVHEVALQRLAMEQRKLRRVGVEFNSGPLWKGERVAAFSQAAKQAAFQELDSSDQLQRSI